MELLHKNGEFNRGSQQTQTEKRGKDSVRHTRCQPETKPKLRREHTTARRSGGAGTQQMCQSASGTEAGNIETPVAPPITRRAQRVGPETDQIRTARTLLDTRYPRDQEEPYETTSSVVPRPKPSRDTRTTRETSSPKTPSGELWRMKAH